MADRLDLLLFHAYYLADDPHEQEIMRPFPPLGLQYLVGWLKHRGFAAVDWIDATFQSGPAEFHARCEESDPRVVGLYGHTVTRPVARPMIARCREEGRRVIAGGPDPVQYVEEYLGAGVEVIVVGEGEVTTEALLTHLAANRWQWDFSALRAVPGLIFRHEGEVVHTAPRPLIRPLDQIPWPERRHADLERYFSVWRARHGETAMSMVTSRGCPYKCSWCSKQVYGDTYRRRSVEDVLDELDAIRHDFDPDQIWFADDLFTLNKTWTARFCREMVRRRSTIPFYVIARPETLTPQMCNDLAAAGCYRVYLSAESGAQHILDAMNKRDRVEHIYEAGVNLRCAGIELGVFVMIGYPGERREDIDATLEMLHFLDPEVLLLSVAHPMKGTPFYDQVADRVIRPKGWEADNGGRLAFEMDYSRRFYDVAQRMIWAETGLVRKLRRGEYDLELARLAIKTPLYRAAARLLARPTLRADPPA
jgi:anaerobic magnesium-protoporphyrin IX monomethyl ester cyclase